MRSRAFSRCFVLGAVAVLACSFLLHPRAGAAERNLVEIQFLEFSDWHGQLDPVSVIGVGNVGGAATLSAYFQLDRFANPNTLTLTAGDSVGGTPPLSSLFDDEPAIYAMNLMGVDVNTLGNHNFNDGVEHLQQLIELSDFPYVVANIHDPDGLIDTIPYEVFDLGGVQVAVVGILNPEAPTLVLPGNFSSITITDPVAAANRARADARKEGADVFVAITHLGVDGFDGTGAAYGPLIDFVDNVGNFDVVFGDHTDILYNQVHKNTLVVENRSKGVSYARVSLVVDVDNGRVDSRSATIVTPLFSAVIPDPAIENMLAPYRALLVEAFDETIGVANGIFARGGNIERLGEVPIGNLITDAMRDAYGTDIAFTNGGGIRSSLPSSYAPTDSSLRRPAVGYQPGPPYDLVVADPFTVLPFGNEVVTGTISGSLLCGVLENSVSALPSASGRFLQISGFAFTYDVSNPVGSRVVSVQSAGGTPMPCDATTYTVATNDFLMEGGDGYAMLVGVPFSTRALQAEVLLDYIVAQGIITPYIDGRILPVTP